MTDSPTQILFGTIIILIAAVSIVALFHRMRISPLLGYFVSGAAIGAHGFGLVQSHTINILGEFGILFLLFLIGLELTFERLIAMRRHVFGLGGIQVTITTLSIIAISYYYGVSLKVCIIIGGGLALSSTAIVLQLLQEKKSTSSQVGRLSIAILLLQDFAVVPLLVLVPLLVSESSGSLVGAILQSITKAIFALVFIIMIGRLLVRPFFNMIVSTKNDELFIATTLLIILGTAYITNYFDLSMALGAFIAGLLMGETEYCHEIEQVILPFKKLLLGLFFMAIGMSIDLSLLSTNLLSIIFLSIFLMLFKSIIIIALCLLFKCEKESSINTGFLLSQGGEFAFILFNLDASKEIIPENIAQILMAVVTITMALTPLVSYLGIKLTKTIFNNSNCATNNKQTTEELLKNDIMNIDQHVIIAGFSKAGEIVSRILDVEQINYIAIDNNHNLVDRWKEKGGSVYCGDITDIVILKALRVERSRAMILTITNETVAKKVMQLIKDNYPEIIIIVQVSDLSDALSYYSLGADKLIPETYEIGLQLGAATLSSLGFSDAAITVLKERFRKSNYSTINKK